MMNVEPRRPYCTQDKQDAVPAAMHVLVKVHYAPFLYCLWGGKSALTTVQRHVVHV
jgi:hypothetical protein